MTTPAPPQSSPALRPEQVRAFAEGLYYIAATDGIDDREIALIQDFLAEAGFPEWGAALGEDWFDPAAAGAVLETSHLRRVFLKAAVVLVRADGALSAAERRALQTVAAAFGLLQELPAIEQEVAGEQLA